MAEGTNPYGPEAMHQSGLQTLLAVDVVTADAYRNIKHINTRLARLQTADARPASAARAMGRIIGWTFAAAREAEIETLRPGLNSLAEALPFMVDTDAMSDDDADAMIALRRLSLQSGAFLPWSGPQPAISAWIDSTVREVQACMLEARNDVTGADAMGRITLGTIFALRNMLNLTSDWYRETSRQSSHHGHIVGDGIQQVKAALEYTLLYREIERDPEGFASGTMPTLIAYIEHHFRLYASKLHPQATFARATMATMEKHQRAFAEIVRCLLTPLELDAWAQRLETHLAPVDPDAIPALDPEPALPWNDVLLLRRSPDGDVILYATSGYTQMRTIAMTQHDGPPREPLTCSMGMDDREVSMANSMASYKAAHQPRHFHPLIDRLAPVVHPPEISATMERIDRAEAVLHRDLLALWDRHPSLFAVGELTGIIGFADTAEGTALLYAASCEELIRKVLPAAQHRDITAITTQFPTITLVGEWRAALLTPPSPAIVAVEPAVTPLPEKQPSHRAAIRKAVGATGRIPSLEWIVERLQRLGEIECTTMHGTSHRSIYFRRNGEEHRYVTSPSIRGHESLPIHILYAMLRTLSVSEAEFAALLTNGGH